MMKYIRFFLVSFIVLWFFGCKDFSEKPNLSKGFIKYYGTGDEDLSGKLQITDDGGYILVGTSKVAANTDITLVKTDKLGNMIWQRYYGGSDNDSGWSVKVLATGGYVVASTYVNSLGISNMYLMKLNNDGDTIWTRSLNEVKQRNSYGYDVAVTADQNNYIIAGAILETNTTTGIKQAYLRRLNSSGEITLAPQPYGITNFQTIAYGALEGEANGLQWIGIAGVKDIGPSGYFVRYNNFGSIIAFAGNTDPHINEPSMIEAKEVITTSDGGYIMIGSSINGAGTKSAFLFKFTVTNNNVFKVWYNNSFSADKFSNGYTVAQTTDGGYIMAGSISNPSLENSQKGGALDIYIVKTDADGNKLWENSFGGPSDDYATSIKQTSDGGYVLAATVTLITTPTNGKVMSILKLDAKGNLTN